MASIIRAYDESEAISLHDNSESFEFVSTTLNEKTGLYGQQFLINEEVFAEKTGAARSKWKIVRSKMELLTPDWEDFGKMEQDEMIDNALELVNKLASDHFGKVLNDVVGDPQPKAGNMNPLQNLGEACEALSGNKDFGDRLLKIKARVEGMIGLQEFGISFYRPVGNKDGGFLTVFQKLEGMPAWLNQWKSYKLPILAENGDVSKGSSSFAMKNSYNGQWGLGDVIQNWQHIKASENATDTQPALTFEQVCSEYPNHLFVKIMQYGV